MIIYDDFEPDVPPTPEERERVRRFVREIKLTLPPGAHMATVSRTYAFAPWSEEFKIARALAETGHLGEAP